MNALKLTAHKHLTAWTILAGLLWPLSGCGARASTMALHATDPAEARAWNALRPGERIAIFDGKGSCPVVVAPTVSALNRAAEPLSKQPWATSAAVFTVRTSMMMAPQGDSPGSVVMQLTPTQGPAFAMRWTPDGNNSCVWPYSPPVGEALALVGKKLVFAPWKAGCTRIEAAGTSPDGVLIESEAGQVVQLEGVELGSASASKLRSWNSEAPVAVWFKANRGTLHLRQDTVQTCFAEQGEPSAVPPQDPTARLRTDASRCTSDEVDGKRHVACSTSLGVWEGQVDHQAVSLRLVRRTLGPLHLVEGRPVSGGRFARTVVGVRMASPGHAREQTLYTSMSPAIAAVLSGDDGLVRVAAAGDPSVTLPVGVAIKELQIGELQTREEKQQSEYESHKETRPNPDKPKAEAEVESARDGVQQAREDFKRRKEEEKEQHAACMSACGEINDSKARNVCKAGCGVLRIVTADDASEVKEARNRLRQAERELATTPDTVQVPIMAKWDYTRKLYSRSIVATLELEIGFRSSTRRDTIKVTNTVTDYDVDDDPKHNVKGHRADRALLNNPDNQLPAVAKGLSTELGRALRAAVNQEMQESAMRTFAEAGGEAPHPEYHAVDAMAHGAAGKRLRKALQRGVAEPKPNGNVVLPSAAVELGASDCLLAVAVSEGSTSASLRLATAHGGHADLRGNSFAVVEACGADLAGGSGTIGELVLSASEPAKVRWALYRVVLREQPEPSALVPRMPEPANPVGAR